MQEEWKDVIGYEGIYQVSNLGRVKNITRDGNILEGSKRGEYSCHGLRKDNNLKQIATHKLVAQSFIPNPEDKPFVNHLDEDKLNNNMNNLEWVTASENMMHGTARERSAAKKRKPVCQLDLDGNLIQTWGSAAEAAKELNLNAGGISRVATGKAKTCGGFIWKREVEEPLEELNKEGEEWKDVEGYEGLYQISSLGRLKSFYGNKKEIKKGTLKSGYRYYELSKNRSRKVKAAHKMVAEAFIPNVENKPVVNHIDENKLNNDVKNLEWSTYQENVTHGTARQRTGEKNCIPILQISLDGRVLKKWDSIKQATEELNIKRHGISQVLGGRQKTSSGFFWEKVQ